MIQRSPRSGTTFEDGYSYAPQRFKFHKTINLSTTIRRTDFIFVLSDSPRRPLKAPKSLGSSRTLKYDFSARKQRVKSKNHDFCALYNS